MVVADAGKLAVLLAVIVGMFVLIVTSKADFKDVAPFFTLIVGFLIGNGETAVRKRAPSPVLTAPVTFDEIVTIHGSYPVERTIVDVTK